MAVLSFWFTNDYLLIQGFGFFGLVRFLRYDPSVMCPSSLVFNGLVTTAKQSNVMVLAIHFASPFGKPNFE